jgi:hypothetical protein
MLDQQNVRNKQQSRTQNDDKYQKRSTNSNLESKTASKNKGSNNKMRSTTNRCRPDINHNNKNYIMRRRNWVNNYVLTSKLEE